MSYTFFAMMERLKFINRWALMRNSREENLSEHSLDVAILAEALCLIGNKRLGKKLNADRAAVIALFHDASEIITGDMPTPVKYLNPEIKKVYKEIEAKAVERLLDRLPSDLKEEYREIMAPKGEDYLYERKLVKAADKLSAYIKCLEEKKTGNTEFKSAEEGTKKALIEMELPEVDHFIKDFLPAYEKTLDEL